MRTDDDRARWLATALARTETLLERLREKTALDEDWLDEIEGRAHALFRDLAVMLGLASRATRWADLGERDPLDAIREHAPHPRVTQSKQIVAALRACDPRTPADDTLALATDAEDALSRLARFLDSLARLRTDATNERRKDQLEDLLAR